MSIPSTGLCLSLGCGETLPLGDQWVGIDIRPMPRDSRVLLHDLECYPWPIESESCGLVVAGLIIEHINPAKLGIFKFMDEIWRVLKPDCALMLSTPFAGSPMSYADPAHLTSFVAESWLYFDPLHQSGLYKVYKPKPWKIKACTFQVSGTMEVMMEKRREDKSYYA